MDTGAAPERASLTPQLVMGLLIIVVGVLFTLDNLGIAYAEDYLRYWPAGLIAIGLVKLWQCRGGSAGSFAGSLFVLAGLLLLADSLGVVRVSIAQLWPLALVFFGASMVWRGVHGRPVLPSDSTATVSGIAILGGVKRGNNSRAFKGGDLTAIMGGCEIDLRQAAIDGEATLELFAMWGGIELRVPEDWTVISRVVPLLGGVEDKTRPPQGAVTHRLVLRGFAIMGGIEVKN
jgi:predicted membrane protein